MSRRDPKRLRLVANSALQRRVLDETAHEEPSPELRNRMAQALGVSTAAVASSAALAKTAAAAAEASAKVAVGASASTTPVLPWITVGALGLALAGAIVGTRAWKTSPSAQPSPAVNASAPESEAAPVAPAPSLAAQPASSALAPPQPESSTLSAGRRPHLAALPIDVRDQTSLVDAAREAVSSGAADRALALLRQYQDRYPGGVFRPEAAALKIEALARLGRGTEVRSLADRFVAQYGNGPLTDRVRHVADLAQP